MDEILTLGTGLESSWRGKGIMEMEANHLNSGDAAKLVAWSGQGSTCPGPNSHRLGGTLAAAFCAMPNC